MNFLINLIASGVAVFLAAYITPGVYVNGFVDALVVAVVLALVNATLGAILRVLAFPINMLTLGLISALIGLLMIFVTAQIVPGFGVTSWLSALIFAILLGLISGLFGLDKKRVL